MNSVQINNSWQPEWEEFFKNSSDCPLPHVAQLIKVINISNDHTTYFITVVNEFKLVGILPLFLVRKGLLGKFFTSLPGGIIAKNESVRSLIIEKAIQLTNKMKLNYLHIKDSYIKVNDHRLLENKAYYHMIIDKQDIEGQWNYLKSRTRNRIRRSLRNNFSFSTDISHFDKVYSTLKINYKRLGSPLPSKGYFKNIIETLGEEFQVLSIIYNDKVIGGSCSLSDETKTCILWFSCLPSTFSLYSNYALYWETIKRASNNDIQLINLGTSRRHTGNYQFKSQWKSYPKNIINYYYLRRSHIHPDFLTASENRIWLKLLRKFYQKSPICISNLLNSYLSSFEPIAF